MDVNLGEKGCESFLVMLSLQMPEALCCCLFLRFRHTSCRRAAPTGIKISQLVSCTRKKVGSVALRREASDLLSQIIAVFGSHLKAAWDLYALLNPWHLFYLF